MALDPRLISAFSNALQIAPETVLPELAYQSIPQWDSISHMVLVAEIESTFSIMLETDDVIDLSSAAKAEEIIRKYGISL